MGLGQLRGPSWETWTPLDCPIQMTIVALGGLEVCDGGHWLIVMKKCIQRSVSNGQCIVSHKACTVCDELRKAR
jgi:hypothetical protein